MTKTCYLMLITIFILTQISCVKTRQTGQQSTESDSIWNNQVKRISLFKHRIDSINATKAWKKMANGLWKSKYGDIGIATQEGTEQGISIDKYITTLCCEGKPLKEIIDTLTFQYMGSSFYKDKNNIYTHYIMADGGNFWIVEDADIQTFEVLGDCYAKDKNHIYGERTMVMDSVDYATFKTAKGCGCYAKDKNGFYFWDSKIAFDEIVGENIQKIL